MPSIAGGSDKAARHCNTLFAANVRLGHCGFVNACSLASVEKLMGPLLKLMRGNWFGKIKALSLVTADGTKEIQLLGCFNAFDDGL